MITALKNLLYIFQLSEYDPIYFSNWVLFHLSPSQWVNLEKKARLKWTFKARLLFFTALIFAPFFYIISKKKLPNALLFAQTAIRLFERIGVILIAGKAKKKLAKQKKLKVIGIAGSFGKTTAKEYLAHILSQKYKVIKTPENINTILGVANFILKTDFSGADIFVVEIGAYYRGDVKKLCDIIEPQISVLTGIGHEHLERFGNLKNIFDTEFEIISNLGEGAVAIIPKNQKSKIKNQNYKLKIKMYGLNKEDNFHIKNLNWGIGDCLVDIYKGNHFFIKAKIPVIAEHQLDLALAALTVADELNLNRVEMKLALESLPQVSRRLTFSQTPQDIWILDDSYNITIEGAEAALKVLNRHQALPSRILRSSTSEYSEVELRRRPRRRIVLSAGIPETGTQKKTIHHQLGKLYAQYCDLLLLVQNSTTSYIIEGMANVGDSPLSKSQMAGDVKNVSAIINDKAVKIFKDASKAQEALSGILKPGDIILIQAYDWPDHYY